MAFKGEVANWILIIGGIIIGMMIMVLATAIFGGTGKQQQEMNMMSEFNRLADRVQSVCGSGFGNYATVEVRLAEIVRAIYPAKGETEPPPDKVAKFISENTMGKGDYICLQFFEKPTPRCREVGCPINMTYIGTPGLKQDIFSILARLRGEAPEYDYALALEKMADGVVDARGRQFAGNLSLPSGRTLADMLFARLAILGSSQIVRQD